MIWISVCVAVCAVAGLCRIGVFRSGGGSLPRDFDFEIEIPDFPSGSEKEF